MIRRSKDPAVMFAAPSAYVLSGLATWLDYMEPGLTQLGWRVTIGLVEGPRHHRPEHYLASHPHTNWHVISCRTGTTEGRMRAIERAIAEVEPDIIATVNLPDAILGAARSRQRHRLTLKVAMTVHGIQPDLYDDLRTYAPWLDRVFCTNRLACELAEERGGLEPLRISYAPCGVAFGGPLAREGPSDHLKIVYAGRLEQDQKRIFDLPLILSALEASAIPYELLIAGNGPDEEQLRAKFSARIDDGRVKFLGFIPAKVLQLQIFSKVDVLLLSSPSETGPIVIWEAMAAGVAVVSSRYVGSGLESALRDGDNALMFDIGDTLTAAAQLARLWREKGLIAKLRQGGYRLIKSRYSIPVSVANWDRHLRSLLTQSPRENVPAIGVHKAPGRLDWLLGASAAESLRSLLGATGPDGGPGGEWPHSHGGTDYWDERFWAQASELDRRGGEEVAT